MTLEICRICGSRENLKHVFSEGSNELVEQIRLCANIQIDALDCLPKFVCNVCEQGLAFSYRLRKRGEETEKKLREGLLISNKSRPYRIVKNADEKSDVVEILVEESCDDQLWNGDDDSVHFNEHENLTEQVADTDEDISQILPDEDISQTLQDEDITQTLPDEDISQTLPDESCYEQWIGLPNEDFSESNELTEDTGTEKEVLMELIYEGNEISDELDHTETQILTKRKTRKTEVYCETCGDVFETKSKYGEHIKQHGDKRFHCVICDKWFSVRYRYDQHMMNHSSEGGAFPCPKCDKSYTIQCNLERHIRSVHNGEKRFQCTECGSSFGRADILKMHMAKHSNERNIECNICQKKFKTSQHLHYHKRSHMQKIERPKKPVRLGPKPKVKVQVYLCEFCDKVSHHRTTHMNHLRTHTGEKPFKCSMCDKAFRTTHARSNHMLLHTDQRPHQCKVCGTSFRQTAHLKSHMLIHTGVKRHVCEFCQKAFTMKSNLMVHLRMHTREAPYKCNKCPQKFFQLSQVKRHKKSHMSEDEPRKEACDSNVEEMGSDFNDSEINLYIEDIIEINSSGGDSVVMSESVVEEC